MFRYFNNKVHFTLEQVIKDQRGYLVCVCVWLMPRPSHCTHGKETQYPLYRRLGGSHCLSGRVRKISTPSGFDPRTFHPVASRYNDYDIRAQHFNCGCKLSSLHCLYGIMLRTALSSMMRRGLSALPQHAFVVCTGTPLSG